MAVAGPAHHPPHPGPHIPSLRTAPGEGTPGGKAQAVGWGAEVRAVQPHHLAGPP